MNDNLVRDFATLVSDRRLEIDGDRWRQAPPTGDRSDAVRVRSWDDDASVIIPVRWARDWRRGSAATISLSPARSPALLDAQSSELSVFDRLSQLMHYAVMPVRLEPLCETKEHRCIASGGNAHGVELWVRLVGTDGNRLYRLDDIEKHLVGLSSATTDSGPTRAVEFIPVARMNALIKIYGEFGLCLLLLEGGMLQAQMMTLALHLGLTAYRGTSTQSAQFFSEGGTGSSSDIVLPGVTIDVVHPIHISETVCDVHFAQRFLPSTENRPLLHQMTQAIQKALDVPTQCESAAPDTTLPRARDPFAATVARTSGEFVTGSGVALPAREIFDLISEAARHIRALDPSCLSTDLALRLVVRDDDNRLQLWDQAADEAWCQIEPTDTAAAAAAAGLGAAVQAILTIHADDRFVRAGSAVGYADAFLRAGRIVQSLCLAGPRHHAFVRPHKAVPDAVVNAQLPIDRLGLVQLHIGALTSAPLRYPLI